MSFLMKWIVRFILLILVLFGLAMLVGWRTSSELNIERSRVINADSFDVFPYMNDLRSFDKWSPWKDLAQGSFVVAGPVSGEGQELAWQSEDPAIGTGSQVIIESYEGSFVRTELNLAGRIVTGTYAIEELEEGQVSALIAIESDLGGFPFIQRLFKGVMAKKTEAQFDRALADLDALVQADLEQFDDLEF